MTGVHIVTDSTAYLPQDIVDKYQHSLKVVPLSVIFPGATLVDGLDIQSRFIELLRTSKEPPTTSQPTPSAFKAAFASILATGQEVVVLTISSKFSGTYASAVTAARELDTDKISVLDSASTAAGLGMQVEAALAAAEAGKTRGEIVELLHSLIGRTRVVFVPDTLEYLRKGGRIGGASALLGSVLQIKPVLTIRGGEVQVLDKVRTRQKALQRLLAELDPGHTGPVGVIHVAAPARAEEMLPLVRSRVPGASLRVYEAGPVMGTHAGPGTVGLSFFA